MIVVLSYENACGSMVRLASRSGGIFHVADIEGRSCVYRRAAHFSVPCSRFNTSENLLSIAWAKGINTTAKLTPTNDRSSTKSIAMEFGWGPDSYAAPFGNFNLANTDFLTPLSTENGNARYARQSPIVMIGVRLRFMVSASQTRF
jgi:hypothetical protein